MNQKYTTTPYKHNGLILYLNSHNNFSYPGPGKMWYDISGSDNHARGDPNDTGEGYNNSMFPHWTGSHDTYTDYWTYK